MLRQRVLGAAYLPVLAARVHTLRMRSRRHSCWPHPAPMCCLPLAAAPTTFSNLYFAELTNNKWKKKKWNGPLQYEDKSGTLMMLPTDMVREREGGAGPSASRAAPVMADITSVWEPLSSGRGHPLV